MVGRRVCEPTTCNTGSLGCPRPASGRRERAVLASRVWHQSFGDHVRHICARGHKGDADRVCPPPNHTYGLSLGVRADAQQEQPRCLYAGRKRNACPPPGKVEHDALHFGLNLGEGSASGQGYLGTALGATFEHGDFLIEAFQGLLLNINV